ncbi:MAG: hypothetical protein A3B91_03650 [Candidatus Yanofskybacteria bacterium RIFCSPHIGHO2_02_FULL_41_29]|uniref:DUF4145 domain-containing protein n=1 Tax=Candidatus Yanofskybacteria bacterium RIFCSPHIGHO2_01_FULL_41_53 TaxID=1802663 RepID=A0A1F8EKL2_9BACT|nr:MAG: hypothetical protein A2650_00695 [Candidatus Yanofskybacteria bacterium RIFCSPHIGHO2_01_FULL_41_53]OGN10853.1 MAG: hypothetical protein A3B91_03650 [Candidatus Yanofskybacteria bacterium RIFCSPHIGHO2_02_FULL_41_29]OGN18535.1 MAG: hypothetical protein A3F48_01165 [Candidatus Yanofskybacteria bacterium RIFCSPHIGHO2_12_FULL_41_9]OGN24484.1 MAG: hypothetical protein A2916_02530 [Candidatus Yanofskybacteria bacterium RIFCSPLOWO2_01_FULL_41_67]OGN29522.1 MAG: hypothetical protein A3H54_01290 
MAQLINFFDANIAEILIRLKLTSVIFSVIFFAIAFYFIYEFRKLSRFKLLKAKSLIRPPKAAYGGASQSRWEEVVRHIESSSEAEWKLALIEADKLVDNLLKSAGFTGDTMGERLTNVEKGQLANLEGLWEAHKIRNKIVHDVNYFLRYGEAKRAVELYEKILEELGGI